MTTLNTIPAEESTLLQKKPQASLKFQAHVGAANASTKAKKIVGAVAAAALVLGVLAATSVTAGVAPTTASLSTPVDMMHQGQPVSCLLKNVVVVEDREMEHRIPEGDIGPDFGKHGKHLCKGPSKDGNVCANAGTDREAYCTYALGPALYPEEFPVDLHFCAYCADDN